MKKVIKRLKEKRFEWSLLWCDSDTDKAILIRCLTGKKYVPLKWVEWAVGYFEANGKWLWARETAWYSGYSSLIKRAVDNFEKYQHLIAAQTAEKGGLNDRAIELYYKTIEWFKKIEWDSSIPKIARHLGDLVENQEERHRLKTMALEIYEEKGNLVEALEIAKELRWLEKIKKL